MLQEVESKRSRRCRNAAANRWQGFSGFGRLHEVGLRGQEEPLLPRGGPAQDVGALDGDRANLRAEQAEAPICGELLLVS